MKLLQLLLLGGLVLLLWRSNRAPAREDPPTNAASNTSPELMVACSHCGLLLPDAEALHGRRGRYCCAAHQGLSEH